MELERLIYQCLAGSDELKALLASYGDSPAIFRRVTPSDVDSGWRGARQYPRMDFFVDLMANPERQTAGEMTLHIWCDDGGAYPEALDALVRDILRDVFLMAENVPYALAWARSDAFESTRENERDGVIQGIALRYDLLAFPPEATLAPSPVTALAAFAAEILPEMVNVQTAGLPPISRPTADAPYLYFRIDQKSINRQTNTVLWVGAAVSAHIIAPGATEREYWARRLLYELGIRGWVAMEDGSPFNIADVRVVMAQPALMAGQVLITGEYGLLWRDMLYPSKAMPVRHIFYAERK